MRVRSPAKVNLTLEVLGKRQDGFHVLRTLMVPVGIFDEMIIRQGEQGTRVTTVGMELPDGPGNLVWEAIEKVRARVQSKAGVHVELRKHIPAGGGLAGGSGNAVTAMRAVNELWRAGLKDEQLHEIAASLGSDLNFFLADGPALCTGRGERIEAVEVEAPRHVVLLHPGFGVATPWAFKTYAAAPCRGEEGRLSVKWRVNGGQSGSAGLKKNEALLRNDLEPVVFGKYPWIAAAKEWCRARPESLDALMSGSGATVFALCADAAGARRLADTARDHFGSGCWIQVGELIL